METRKYLIDRKEEIKNLKVVERDVKIKENVSFINAIIGPRRAGKTYFLYWLIKFKKLRDTDFAFINFAEVEENPQKIPLLHDEIYGKLPKYLFFDEIQEIENWEKSLYRLYEKKKYHIFITGSSSKLLSKEIATQLRGRSIPIKIFPFKFIDVLKLKKIRTSQPSSYIETKIKHALSEYLKNGFFPDVVLRNISPSLFFSEYIDLIIYKDIQERYNIRNRFALEFFIKSAIASHTKQFSINKIYNIMKSQNMKVGKDTLYNFQKYIEDVSFCFFVKKYFQSYRKVEMSIPKVFLVDNGIFSYIERKEDLSKLMEGIVFEEMIKEGLEINKSLFYLESQYGEVDFVIKEGLKLKQLIQVTYASEKDEVEKRELKSLVKASEVLNCKDLLCITWDYKSEEEFKGKKIKFIPLWQWLLKKREFYSQHHII